MSDVYGQADAVEQVETELGSLVTLASGVYPCILGSRAESKDLGMGGFATDSDLVIVIRKELFSTEPVTEELVTVTDRVVRTQTITHAPDGSVLVLACNDSTRGA